jgi:hypothetical protein
MQNHYNATPGCSVNQFLVTLLERFDGFEAGRIGSVSRCCGFAAISGRSFFCQGIGERFPCCAPLTFRISNSNGESGTGSVQRFGDPHQGREGLVNPFSEASRQRNRCTQIDHA